MDRKILITMIFTWMISNQSIAADYKVSLTAGVVSKSTITPIIMPNFAKLGQALEAWVSGVGIRSTQYVYQAYKEKSAYDFNTEAQIPFIGISVDALISPRVGLGVRTKMLAENSNSYLQSSNSMVVEGIGRYTLFNSSIFAGVRNQHHKVYSAYGKDTNIGYYTPGLVLGASAQISENSHIEIQASYSKSKNPKFQNSADYGQLLQPLYNHISSLDMSIALTYQLDTTSNDFFQ